MRRDVIIAIDAGTSVLKSVAFTLGGAQLAVAFRPNTYSCFGHGCVEQDMITTWREATQTLDDLAAMVPGLADRVVALAVTGQGDGCWLIDAILKKYGLTKDPALVLLAKIVNGADTDNTLWNQPESAGVNAVAEGFRHLGLKDDHEINAAEWIVYDALYAYCQEMVRRGKPEGAFR